MDEGKTKGQNKKRQRNERKQRLSRLRYWVRIYAQKARGLSSSEKPPPASSDATALSDSFLFEEHSFGGPPPLTQSEGGARSVVSASPQGVDALDLSTAIEQGVIDLPPPDALEILLEAEGKKIGAALAGASVVSSSASSVGSLMDVDPKAFDDVFDELGKMETIATQLSTSGFAGVVSTVSLAPPSTAQALPSA